MSVYAIGAGHMLDAVFDVNGNSLDVAYDLCGRVIFPTGKLVAAKSYDLSKSWKFKLLTTETGKSLDALGYVAKDCDETDFESVDLPYDWSIRQAFNASSPAAGKGAYLDGGQGVFRKTLQVKSLDRRLVLRFDGAFMDVDVYVNGTKAAENHWWNPFSVDVTDLLDVGNNVIAVHVTVNQPNSRWYSSAGIQRKVWLDECEPEGTPGVGLFKVTTPNIANEAGGLVTTRIGLKLTKDASVQLYVKDASGKTLAYGATKGIDIQKDLVVSSPELWTCESDSPALYYAEAVVDGKYRCRTRFGYRWLKFSKDGVCLNGESFKIKGFCVHEDTNCLGMEASKAADVWKIKKLKSIGCNAIRTCHNPFSKEFIDACDENGMLVCYELFDCWNITKEGNIYDFARNFENCWADVIENSVNRDVNSPAVFCWVAGNEIQLDEMDNSYITSQISAIRTKIREFDESRPVTIGDATLKPAKLSCIVPYLDIIGCNYADSGEYATVRSLYSDMPIMGTEAYSSIHTRGIYADNDESCFCTELDQRKVGWGDYFWSACDMWYGDSQNMGAFMWTGFDYLGEPTPFAGSKYYPAKSSQFGVFDQAGFPKDAAYMFKSAWSSESTVHMGITDWDSWAEGEQYDVRVYSNQPSVELFLNGTSLGVVSTKSSIHAFEYSVAYAPGVLSCVAYGADGGVAATESLSTSLKAVSMLELAPDSDVVDSDEGFAFVACQLLDSNGVPVPTACDEVQFEVTGGTCYGTENGRPQDSTSMKSAVRNAFNGKVLCVVKPDGDTGNMTISAKLVQNSQISASTTIYKT